MAEKNDSPGSTSSSTGQESQQLLSSFIAEIIKSPINLLLVVEELKKYNGKGPDGRILIAINGSVYDCTLGAHFYGPGAPYEVFGGKDISRALAKFSLETSQEYDDLSDLKTGEMESMREWEEQFKEKYDYVGKLLKPGEAPTNYSDEEDEGSQLENETKSKND
ncbi:hypothetical protein QLX08_011164 [Tetragonisca angustula]|uniref:Cytochrome b5 heme-binding domain-containing protein n=1 Tax=Tetragonisca angustula TaxID=166442 RepID=A0AAW0Z9X8_9HYME